MASLEKFTDEKVSAMICHNERIRQTYSNTEIDSNRTSLNYCIPLEHNGLTDFKYYKQVIDGKYLYGRGSSREKDAVTAAGWVVTLPKEISGNMNQEKAFFQGVHNFISDRYGSENIISSTCHYDEGGMPHIHTIFVPSTRLDHDMVHFKTWKTKTTVKTKTGRYEFTYQFKLDENGQRIPLKNYAKMSDNYDEKISANDVLNKVELQHFHPDLQKYLDDHHIAGTVITGTTSGINFSVGQLKEFTKTTGYTLDQIKSHLTEKNILESFLERDDTVKKQSVLLQDKEQTILSMQKEISQLQEQIKTKDDVAFIQLELDHAKQRIKELELEKDKGQTWGKDNAWENTHAGWENQTKEEDHTW